MNKNTKLLLFFTAFLFISAGSDSFSLPRFYVDPHDSLLFDGAGISGLQNSFKSGEKNCYIQVKAMRGTVIGEVVKKEIVAACGVNETLYVSKITELKIGDILVEGSQVITSTGSFVGMGIYLSTDERVPSIFSSLYFSLGEESEIKLPHIQDLCGRLEEHPPQREIPVIKGKITYDAKPDAGIKLNTKGKRSTAKHKKTKYSHEVRIDGIDTVDIIRVYEGSVEVSVTDIDPTEQDAVSKQIEKLGEDMQSGKITAEEMAAKMMEFQNYGQKVNELMTPLEVNEGSKCIITKNSRTVEPLGAGDEEDVE